MSDTDTLIRGLETADPDRIVSELARLERRSRALRVLLKAARSRARERDNSLAKDALHQEARQ